MHTRISGLFSVFIITLFVFIPSGAQAATYLNCFDTEPTWYNFADTLWCDDFEDGGMVHDNTGTANAANDGFSHTSFGWGGNALYFPDPVGTNFGRCGSKGVGGSDCAATSGTTQNGASNQVASMSDHPLSGFITAGQDLYFRYYKKCVTVAGCSWNGNTKLAPTFNRNIGYGIDFTNIGARPNSSTCPTANERCTSAKHMADSKSDFVLNVATGEWEPRLLRQNQWTTGNDDGNCAANHSCWENGNNDGNWYYFQHHIKINTSGNHDGIYEMWMDDCGTDGVSNGCATGGTLRTSYTDVAWLCPDTANGCTVLGQTPSGATQIGALWLEQYSSGYATSNFGEWYWDQIVASRVAIGPMGFVGGGTTSTPASDTTTPTTPTSLTASTISSSQINLSWTASLDNTGVTGYRIYRNGTQIATTATNSYANTSLTPSTTYSYTVSAYDLAGNTSVQSASVSATTPSAPLPSATYLIAYAMNEGSGTTLTDTSGTGHTGTLTTGPTRVASQTGYDQALSFDGVSGSVSVANPATLNVGTADFTIEAWVKRTALGTYQRHIFSKCGTTWSTGCKEFYFNRNNQLTFGSYATGDTFSSTITDTNWHHVAATFTSSSKTLSIYVDGALTTTTTKNLEADNAAHVVTIGNQQNNNTFSGLIDDFRMYSRALTLAEIQSDKATPIAAASIPPSSDTTAPTTPTNLTTSAISSSQINLSWTASTDNVGVTGYRIYRNGTQIATTATNSYSNTTLSPATTYSYTVSAYDLAGNASVQSTSVTVTTSNIVVTPDTIAPSAPTNLTTTTNTATTNTTSGGGGGSASSQPVSSAITSSVATQSAPSTSSSVATTQPITPTPPVTTPTTSSLTLSRSLYQGLKGTDVKNLQTFLIQHNYLAPSNTTGFYGALTKQAVQKYQCAQNIVCSGTETSTGYGVVGLKTRAKLNGTPTPTTPYVSTSTLTPAQADAIIALIQSFGADAAVIARVRVVLGR